jgi:hypothetical protein
MEEMNTTDSEADPEGKEVTEVAVETVWAWKDHSNHVILELREKEPSKNQSFRITMDTVKIQQQYKGQRLKRAATSRKQENAQQSTERDPIAGGQAERQVFHQNL